MTNDFRESMLFDCMQVKACECVLVIHVSGVPEMPLVYTDHVVMPFNDELC